MHWVQEVQRREKDTNRKRETDRETERQRDTERAVLLEFSYKNLLS